MRGSTAPALDRERTSCASAYSDTQSVRAHRVPRHDIAATPKGTNHATRVVVGDPTVAIGVGAAAGLAACAHCAAMCGPLSVFAARDGSRRSLALYHAGRMASYVTVGATAGAVGLGVLAVTTTRWSEAASAWTLAATLGVTGVTLLRPERTLSPSLVAIRPRPSRLASALERVRAALPRTPFALGAMTALLPCGALYSALLLAVAFANPLASGLAMFAFASTSALGLAAVGVVAPLLARIDRALGRRLLGGALLIGAVVFALRPIPRLAGDDRRCCEETPNSAGRP